MTRGEVLLISLLVSAAVTPWTASGQTSVGGTPLVDKSSEDSRSAAERLAPSANSVTLLSRVRLPVAEPPRPRAPFPQTRRRGGVPSMVVGRILFVTGVLVGDGGGTVMMVAGGAIGVYGAFVYFGGD